MLNKLDELKIKQMIGYHYTKKLEWWKREITDLHILVNELKEQLTELEEKHLKK